MRLLPEDPVKRGRLQLLLLIGVFVLPLAGSGVAYLFHWSTGHTSTQPQCSAEKYRSSVSILQ